MTGTAERICAKFTSKTCLVLRSDKLKCPDQKSKVKVNRYKNDNALIASTEWNALAANNVTHAADATIPSLPRGDFASLRALGLAGYRWALPRISSSFRNNSANRISAEICDQSSHLEFFLQISD